MKGKNLQPTLLYPARISLRFDGEIKIFTDKQKLREFSTTKPAFKLKTIKKMVRGIYILKITLNVNGLNAPTKRH